MLSCSSGAKACPLGGRTPRWITTIISSSSSCRLLALLPTRPCVLTSLRSHLRVRIDSTTTKAIVGRSIATSTLRRQWEQNSVQVQEVAIMSEIRAKKIKRNALIPGIENFTRLNNERVYPMMRARLMYPLTVSTWRSGLSMAVPIQLMMSRQIIETRRIRIGVGGAMLGVFMRLI